MESEKINLGENTNGYIKLIKNTKGYNWEIKMFKSDNLLEITRIKDDIKMLNDLMVNEFGSIE